MDLKDIQDLMLRLYGKRDKERGIEGTFVWLVEEIGELSKAIRKKDSEGIKEEMADVLAWLFSLANVLGIDLAKCFLEKYSICPRCKNIPCICPM
ncbi:MAG: MazG nucleotide pyrophosphohydrolase domain-containing protein [Candidatus Methanomethylicaceae archaeon]|nr:MazG nucleotide pyrophosphohydrolase domain-containing protein [Candidatus Verstraetearchaeota archaeon]